MDARGDLDIVPVAFKAVTLRCLCRSAGKSNQQCCWTMQIDDKEDKSMPGIAYHQSTASSLTVNGLVCHTF